MIHSKTTQKLRESVVRPFRTEDRPAVEKVLDFLPALYPDGQKWLSRTFDQIESDEAYAVVATLDGQVVGVVIGKTKPDKRFKICTLYVEPGARQRGISSKMLAVVLHHAALVGSTESYITGAHTITPELSKAVGKFGLMPFVTVLNRYGIGRNETIYRCV